MIAQSFVAIAASAIIVCFRVISFATSSSPPSVRSPLSTRVFHLQGRAQVNVVVIEEKFRVTLPYWTRGERTKEWRHGYLLRTPVAVG